MSYEYLHLLTIVLNQQKYLQNVITSWLIYSLTKLIIFFYCKNMIFLNFNIIIIIITNQ